MAKKTFAEAMLEALSFSMDADPRMLMVGAGFTGHGREVAGERDFLKKNAGRILAPPTSEGAVASLGSGAAMAGSCCYVNLGTSTFAYEAWNQIVNEAAIAHYMSGGQITVPVVFHMFHGIRGGGGPQHSHSPQAMYANCAGLEVVLPSSPADVKGLLRSAIESPNPTIVINHHGLLHHSGEVPDGDYRVPFGVADVKRKGRDVTVVATSLMVSEALKAAEELARDGIEIEVVDPRTIVPLDRKGICDSVRRTGRLVVVDEANLTCSIASEVSASVAEGAYDALKAPIRRVARPEVPAPFSPPLEKNITPGADDIARAVRDLLR